LSGSLLIQNRQRAISLNTRLLRAITLSLLTDLLELKDFELAICIVSAPEMARLNETFLQHSGSTDVITFDYSENPSSALHGEIFICIDDARAQAREFRTSWQSEITRYVIHGILHLRGFDDLRPAARRKMKVEENRLLKKIGVLFPLRKLGGSPKLAA
jgi:probable rRNA maturation factor